MQNDQIMKIGLENFGLIQQYFTFYPKLIIDKNINI